MANFHVEVHSRDRIIEHYILLFCKNRELAIERIRTFYRERAQVSVGLWEIQEDRDNLQIPFLIFQIDELEDDPVIFVSGEYRSQFPI